MMSIALMALAGGVVGFITPPAFGPEGWKFWIGIAATWVAYFAGIGL